MIEFAVCMIALHAKLASKPDNERKSNNGVTNEIGVREMRAKTRGGWGSVHLHLRVHVLPRMHASDGSGVSELRRRISEEAAERQRLRIVGQALRLPRYRVNTTASGALALQESGFAPTLDPIGQKTFFADDADLGERAPNTAWQEFLTQSR